MTFWEHNVLARRDLFYAHRDLTSILKQMSKENNFIYMQIDVHQVTFSILDFWFHLYIENEMKRNDNHLLLLIRLMIYSLIDSFHDCFVWWMIYEWWFVWCLIRLMFDSWMMIRLMFDSWLNRLMFDSWLMFDSCLIRLMFDIWMMIHFMIVSLIESFDVWFMIVSFNVCFV